MFSAMLCIVILQLHICVLTKLALETCLQKCKDCHCCSSREYGSDNCYRGKLPLHGVDFFVPPLVITRVGGFFHVQDSDSHACSPHCAALGWLWRDRQQAELLHQQLPTLVPLPAPRLLAGHE